MMDASQVSHDIFLRVVIVSGQGALLVLLIVGLQRLLRDYLSPAWRYTLWGLLPIRLLLLWSVPTAWSLFTALHRIWLGACDTVFAPAVQASAPGESFAPALSSGGPAFSGMQWAVGIWLCGAAVTLALALMQAYRLGRQARQRTQVTDSETLAVLDECRRLMGIRRRIPILCGPDSGSPGLLGFIQPRLLVPLRLLAPEAREHLRCVLLHELAHIRRRDVLTGWLAYLLLCLHWFNPVLWWAKRRCAHDRELACDARVLSLLTPAERRAYGHALLDQFRARSLSLSSPGLVGVLEGTSSIERRIEMIASFGQSARKGSIPALAAILLLAVTALTGAEETVMANPSTERAVPVAVVPETVMLLAREMPMAQHLPLPAETAESSEAQPQTIPPAEEPAAPAVAIAEPKPEASPAPAANAPVKADKNRPKAAKNTAEPIAASTPRPADTAARSTGIEVGPDSTSVPGSDKVEEKAASAAPAEMPTGKNPATLHSAINKAAKEYADSVEVKSTRPGEDLPFTLTVGGSMQVRGEYRSGMPKYSGLRHDDGFGTSMRTRVSLCADFGQVQCVVEASKSQGRAGFFGPRDAE